MEDKIPGPKGMPEKFDENYVNRLVIEFQSRIDMLFSVQKCLGLISQESNEDTEKKLATTFEQDCMLTVAIFRASENSTRKLVLIGDIAKKRPDIFAHHAQEFTQYAQELVDLGRFTTNEICSKTGNVAFTVKFESGQEIGVLVPQSDYGKVLPLKLGKARYLPHQ